MIGPDVQRPDASALPPEFDEWAALRTRLSGLRRHAVSLAIAAVVGGAIGYGGSFLLTPTYQSTVLFIPPQQQGGAAAALASLGSLASLVGGSGSVKSPADQYVSMLQSVTVSDRIVQHFDLMKVYQAEFHEDARKVLAKNVQVTGGRKDGLIKIEVEDIDSARAAAIANQYVVELNAMTSHLALTEAQQRAMFFGRLLQETKERLTTAQVALEATGISAGALKAEPKSAADTYAKLRAELTEAQVRLQVLRNSLADTSAQVQKQMTQVQALGDQVARVESTQADQGAPTDYVGKYRDFKYQETLFELYSKQFELARVDEAREGAVIQVVDAAQPAERKHFPRRAAFAALGAFLILLGRGSQVWRRPQGDARVETSAP